MGGVGLAVMPVSEWQSSSFTESLLFNAPVFLQFGRNFATITATWQQYYNE